MATKVWNTFMKKYAQVLGFYMALSGGVATAAGKVTNVEFLKNVGSLEEGIGNLMIAASFEYDD